MDLNIKLDLDTEAEMKQRCTLETIRRDGFILLETMQIMYTSAVIDTVISRYEQVVGRIYPQFISTSAKSFYLPGIQQAIQQFKDLKNITEIEDIQMILVGKPDQPTMTYYYAICLVNALYRAKADQIEQIEALKRLESKRKRIPYLISDIQKVKAELYQLVIEEDKYLPIKEAIDALDCEVVAYFDSLLS